MRNSIASLALVMLVACGDDTVPTRTIDPPEAGTSIQPAAPWDQAITSNSNTQLDDGRRVFRDDTFGSEQFFGDQLHLNEAIATLTPKQVLGLGLKVDVARLPADVVTAIQNGTVDLDSPATTLQLLSVDSVVGVKGFFDANQKLVSVGITCSFCHATVDNSLTTGIGNRLDGWPNRDLNVGAIVAAAPNLTPFQTLLGVSRETVVMVLMSWGPGKYDAELNLDGKAFQPDGRSAATVIPAAFGLAGQNLHTYTGFGSVPYWNAFVANTQMHGKGTFVDRRLTPDQFPLVRQTGFNNKRDDVDLITAKLSSLQFYQLAIPAPTPPNGSFDAAAAERGKAVFDGAAKCATCHVPPLYSEPGFAMHTGAEIGIDNFQANRSPTRMYRTTPLKGLFTRATPGFYHDGRFPTLEDVVDHYATVLRFTLSAQEKADLVEYLKSL